MDTAVEIGTLLAQLLPGLFTLYDKIAANNQNSGLVPASVLLEDVLTISDSMEKTAEQQIADAQGDPPQV